MIRDQDKPDPFTNPEMADADRLHNRIRELESELNEARAERDQKPMNQADALNSIDGWKQWFAWHPVRISAIKEPGYTRLIDRPEKWVWLRRVERKWYFTAWCDGEINYEGGHWEYRLPSSETQMLSKSLTIPCFGPIRCTQCKKLLCYCDLSRRDLESLSRAMAAALAIIAVGCLITVVSAFF